MDLEGWWHAVVEADLPNWYAGIERTGEHLPCLGSMGRRPGRTGPRQPIRQDRFLPGGGHARHHAGDLRDDPAMSTPRSIQSPGITRAQLGFGMVELMLALALGLVIVAAMGQLYGGSKKAYQVGDSLTRLNENGRFAVDLLARELRMAGYLSCGGSAADIANTVNGAVTGSIRSTGIEGFEGGVDSPPSELRGPGSRRHRHPDHPPGRGRSRPGTGQRHTREREDGTGAADHGLETGGIVVISDPSCTQASLFQVTDVLADERRRRHRRHRPCGHRRPESRQLHGRPVRQLRLHRNTSGATRRPFEPGSTLSNYSVRAYFVTASDPPTLASLSLCLDGGQPKRVPTRPDP